MMDANKAPELVEVGFLGHQSGQVERRSMWRAGSGHLIGDCGHELVGVTPSSVHWSTAAVTGGRCVCQVCFDRLARGELRVDDLPVVPLPGESS